VQSYEVNFLLWLILN